MFFSCLSVIDIFELSVVAISFRDWVWSEVYFCKHIWWQSGWFANGTTRDITLLHTKVVNCAAFDSSVKETH